MKSIPVLDDCTVAIDIDINDAGGAVRAIEEDGRGARGETLVAGKLACLIGMVVLFFSITLTVRTYTPCPYWDEWDFLSQMAGGAKLTSWRWLWSQHNEHRLVMTRVLVWMDYAAFGGKNISLFLEMYAIQLFAWGSVCYALERFTAFSVSLKRLLQGIFLFCVFYPAQAENFTWAFQVSFIACFAIGTVTLLSVTFFEHIPKRWIPLVAVCIGMAPILAAVNLSAGLLIGPAVIGLALWNRRIPPRVILLWTAAFVLTFAAYLYDHHSDPASAGAFQQPGRLLLYVLAYFDTAWLLFFLDHHHVATIGSVCLLITVAIRAARRKLSNFEKFAVAQCVFVLMTACATAVGRLHYGLEQASASRYQSPAMLYWASCAAILLIGCARHRRARMVSTGVVLAALCWLLLFLPGYWRLWVSFRERARAACYAVMLNQDMHTAVGVLHPKLEPIQRGSQLLRSKWYAR